MELINTNNSRILVASLDRIWEFVLGVARVFSMYVIKLPSQQNLLKESFCSYVDTKYVSVQLGIGTVEK